MAKKLGAQTLLLDSTPSILSYSAVASKKEGEGPLGPLFDVQNDDTSFGQQS